jgi:SAM-dependent methyltransferase
VERFLVPIYLPRWLHEPIRKAKRALVRPAEPATTQIDILGERNVEWSFLSAEMPNGPGEAIEFGCENGYMSLLAAQRGFNTVANDLQEQAFLWKHPKVQFSHGDFLELDLPRNYFDLAINCSSVEHVGVAGRYGIESGSNEGDLDVMNRIAEILKPNGLLLMTAPCGRDTTLSPWCRVYGNERLPRLFGAFRVVKQEFWSKSKANQWEPCTRETALAFEPRNHPTNPHACAYALGCFVLSKSSG